MAEAMSSLLAENLTSRLTGSQKAWWKKAQCFTVATGASQLVAACLLAVGHFETPAVWLAVSGLVVGTGVFVVPWGHRRLRPNNRQAAQQRLKLFQALSIPARNRYLRLMMGVSRPTWQHG